MLGAIHSKMKAKIFISGTIILAVLIYFFAFTKRTEVILPFDYTDDYVVLVLRHEGSKSLDWGLTKKTIRFDKEGLVMSSTKYIDLNNVVFVDENGNTKWKKEEVEKKIADLQCFITSSTAPDNKAKAVIWYLSGQISKDSTDNFYLGKLGKACRK